MCFLPNGKLVCYHYNHIYILKEGVIENKINIHLSKKDNFLGWSKVFTRLMRLGVRTAIAVNNDAVILSVNNSLYELNLVSGSLSKGYFCGEGVRPLIMTNIQGIDGFADGIYYGEYTGVLGESPIKVYRRTGIDKWTKVYCFAQGEVDHIHNIIPDPYRRCLWIFSGDFNEAAGIWKVSDNFKKVERVVYNDQKYRGCVAFALREGILYATDAPFTDNYIYLLDVDSRDLKRLIPIDGSCIYGCKWKDDYVFSSTVEGDMFTKKSEFLFSRKRGKGIKNDDVHLYCGNLSNGFTEIVKESKDGYPYYAFQYGVFKFPCGNNVSDMLYYQPFATKYNDLDLMSLFIE